MPDQKQSDEKERCRAQSILTMMMTVMSVWTPIPVVMVIPVRPVVIIAGIIWPIVVIWVVSSIAIVGVRVVINRKTERDPKMHPSLGFPRRHRHKSQCN